MPGHSADGDSRHDVMFLRLTRDEIEAISSRVSSGASKRTLKLALQSEWVPWPRRFSAGESIPLLFLSLLSAGLLFGLSLWILFFWNAHIISVQLLTLMLWLVGVRFVALAIWFFYSSFHLYEEELRPLRSSFPFTLLSHAILPSLLLGLGVNELVLGIKGLGFLGIWGSIPLVSLATMLLYLGVRKVLEEEVPMELPLPWDHTFPCSADPVLLSGVMPRAWRPGKPPPIHD